MFSLSSAPTDARRLRQDAMGWFVRRRDAGWSAADEVQFQAWLATDPHHAVLYAACNDQWQQMDGMPADLLTRMRDRLATDKAQAAERPPAQPWSRRQLLSWPVASVMAASMGGVGYVAWLQLQAQPMDTQVFRTERGQQRNVTLADGSQLRLDTATQVEVRLYRGRREVQLMDGQAVFDVQANGSPFHVLAGNTRVTVVGTRFSVRYTPEVPGNALVRVSVEEGKVRVAPLDPAEMQYGRYDLQAGLLLQAGQQVVGASGDLTEVPPEGIAPWRDQRVSFVDVPLSQALSELERYHATGLRVSDPQVAAMRLSGTFDPMATAALYKALPRVLPVQLVTRGAWREVVAVD